jgi:hypothetical protein
MMSRVQGDQHVAIYGARVGALGRAVSGSAVIGAIAISPLPPTAVEDRLIKPIRMVP